MTPRAARLLHRASHVRLAWDRWRSPLPRGGAGRRILCTACWRFPIYSQTFVYQEVSQLLNRGHDAKFLYSELDRSHRLPNQFAGVWRQSRRMFLSEHVADEDFAYFERRMPDRVDALIRALCDASGLEAAQLRRHTHFRQSFSFARVAMAFRPHYLHSYFFYEGSLFTLVASTLLEVPRGVSCYSDHALDDYDLKVVPLQLRHSDLLIATSNRIKHELLSMAPDVDPDRIVVKPNAINADHFPAVARTDPGPGEPYRLVCVSRLDPKKGLIVLVRALRLLRDGGTNAVLHVVGAIDPDQPSSAEYAHRLEAEIAALNLAPWVHLEGQRSEAEVRRFLHHAHVFVAPFVELPSGDKDGIPTTIPEAMATGLPVVATDAGSIGEAVEDGVDGVIVPQRRPEALAAAIADLLGAPARRASMGERAAIRARSQLHVSEIEGRFHAALDRVLNAPARPRSVPAAAQEPFPPSMVLAVESRHPLQLPRETVDLVLSQPVGGNLPASHAAPGGSPHASIVVVTHGNLVFTRMCLESVISHTRPLTYELVVVDNASQDGTPEYLRALAACVPQVRVILNARNAGFAAAVNQGLGAARADVLVLLNNDTIVPWHWLTRLLRSLDDPSVGLVGPVTNRAGNEARIDASYTTYAELAAFAAQYCRAQQASPFDIRTATMFCVAMRRDVFERVGPLDERFEIGLFEDDDYSMRVRQAGYAVRCVEDAYVHHFGQASFGSLADAGQYGALFHANRRRFDEKWGCRWEPHRQRLKPAYQSLVEEIRAVVREVLPSGSDVAVISKGDSALLELDGRRGWHFPQNDQGQYAGYYPRDSAEAIAMLERLRAKGVGFLLVPEPAFWWLDHYKEFDQYLREHCRFVSLEPASCAIVDLNHPPAPPQA